MANFFKMPAAHRVDENEPREAPPPATLVQFPSCSPHKQPIGGAKRFNVVELFSIVGRTGALPEHLEAFNITITHNVEFQDLLSADLLPPTSWLDEPTSTEGSDFTSTPPLTSLLSNGRDAPDKKAFQNLAKEVLHANSDAFRAARRLPGSRDRPNPQIIHSRKFWNGLADMSEYWDTSLDQYLDAEDKDKGKDNDAMDIDELRTEAQHADIDQPAEKKKTLYKGRRTDTGSKMPHKFREETVFGFVEMLVWAFGCTVDAPNMQPKVQIHNVLFNLPFNKAVYRVPKDARRARSGIKEGPVMNVWCREQIKFREPGDAEGAGKAEILDLLKESGLITMIAQKRAREGKEEVVPGAGAWWATKPRWGGGSGGEFGSSDTEPIVEEQQNPSSTSSANAQQQPRKRTKKTTQADIWRAMRPPPSLWEKAVSYQQIGKEQGSPYDDVYLVSTVAHHVSIVHTRLHTKYVDFLANGNCKAQEDDGEEWFGMEIQRSQWFDLFKAEDRVELLRGLWGVMRFLMRATDEG